MQSNCKLHLMEGCALCSSDSLTAKLVKDLEKHTIPGYVAPDATVRYTQAWPTPVEVAGDIEIETITMTPVPEPESWSVTTVRPQRRYGRVEFTGRPSSTTANQFAGVDDMEETDSERELAVVGFDLEREFKVETFDSHQAVAVAALS
jgi:hypothetical protein